MNTAYFSSAGMILLECHESPALDSHTIRNYVRYTCIIRMSMYYIILIHIYVCIICFIANIPQFAMIWVNMNEIVLWNKLPRVVIVLVEGATTPPRSL